MNKLRGSLPNILTFFNLSLGVIAILFSVGGETSENTSIDMLVYASLLIMVAALTDRFDGKVARLLDVSSELGKELDSLSDLISFGVAPVIVAWKLCLMNTGIPGYLLVLLFPIAGAYRLARYNITAFNNVFKGIPITIAGTFLSIVNLYNCFAWYTQKFSAANSILTILSIVCMSYLMISNIKIKKL